MRPVKVDLTSEASARLSCFLLGSYSFLTLTCLVHKDISLTLNVITERRNVWSLICQLPFSLSLPRVEFYRRYIFFSDTSYFFGYLFILACHSPNLRGIFAVLITLRHRYTSCFEIHVTYAKGQISKVSLSHHSWQVLLTAPSVCIEWWI